MSVPTEALLRLIAEEVSKRGDLIAALTQSELPGSARVAERLQEGATLDQALGQVIPADLARLLAGPCPDIPASALLVAERLASRRARQSQCWNILAYPLLSFALLTLGLAVVEFLDLIELPWLFLAGVVACAAGGGLLVPWILFYLLGDASNATTSRGWLGHANAADNWRKARLILQWNLNEADAQQWCGPAALAMAQTCSSQTGLEHCETMALVHQDAAQRSAGYIARMLAVWVQLCGASIAVIIASRVWDRIYTGFI